MTKEDWKYFFPYLGVLLITFGAIKIILFYKFFGFSITPYLDLSEIIPLFLSDILYIAILIIIAVITNITIQTKSENEVLSKIINDSLDEQNFIKRLHAYFKSGINSYPLLIFYVIGFPIWYWVLKLPIKYFLIGVLVGSLNDIVNILAYEVRHGYYVKYNKYPKLIYANIGKAFLFIMAVTIFSAYFQYHIIKVLHRYENTKILLTNDTIICTKKVYFIGKTKNYIFINNETDTTITALPISEVKALVIKTH